MSPPRPCHPTPPRPARLAALLVACAGLAAPLLAQDGQPAASEPAPQPPAAQPELGPPNTPGEQFNGRPISRIDFVRPVLRESGVVLLPLTPKAGEFAKNQVRSQPGAPYLHETVSADVARLSRTGRYDTIDASVRQNADGSVTIIYTLEQQPVIEDVQSVGNRRLTDQEIAESVDLLIGTPVDLFQLDRGARRIEDLYHAKGFYHAQVDWDRKELEDNGIVLFRVTEGEKLKVTGVRFEGVQSLPEGELRRQIKTKKTFLFTSAPLDDDLLDGDVAALYGFYRDHGYLDVRVDRRVQPSPNNREAIVSFIIDEGPLYHLGEVILEVPEGALPRFDPAQIAGIIPLKSGDPFSIKEVRESVEAVQAAYHKEGYAEVLVASEELRAEDRPVVNLLVRVSEGGRFLTGEVRPIGNSITKTSVILRSLSDEGVRPETPADPTAMKRSEDRLNRKNIFDRVLEPPRISLQAAPIDRPPQTAETTPGGNAEQPADAEPTTDPPGGALDDAPAAIQLNRPARDPYDPIYRDVLVEVKETDTGEFNIGAAFNTDSGVVARLNIVQRNFDVNDRPDTFGDLFSGEAFRGGGQTLSLELLPGSRVQTYSLSLTEPSLWDTDYSGTAAVFYRNRDYLDYREERYGGRIGVGRRFGTRWVGNALLRAESVQLHDIEADQPVDVFDVADQNFLTGLGFTLTRDTLDDRFRPRRGARTELGIEQVGVLGGDYSFTKLSAEHEFFVPVVEDFLGRTTVFSTKVAASYIPQSTDDVPVYERYYLGGQSFRGFDFRGVSPVGIRNDNGLLGDDPVGGTWSFFLGSQIVHPILEETVAGVLFVDSGTVSNDVGFDDYRVSVGVGIRLYVPQISPAPIGFDFGFPLLEEPTDENRVFTFFIDLPF
ncbi:MAG: BamA/TamA family outer membrane protein [Phycisphaerales bacterium]|nr:BamA/TamA family outer membrane protein [Phycisphaerales bacterium]